MYSNVKQGGKRKGFTLIELLVVIGILVVLATVVVLVLNPGEIFRQARDSKRISDLETLKSAITFYLSSVSVPNMFNAAADNCADTGVADSSGGSTGVGNGDGTGNGWIPLDFLTDGTASHNVVAGGAPIAIEPVDPVNSGTGHDGEDLYYKFLCSDLTFNFKLEAEMESARYSQNGTDDVESDTKDGGTHPTLYEVGTCLNDATDACGGDYPIDT